MSYFIITFGLLFKNTFGMYLKQYIPLLLTLIFLMCACGKHRYLQAPKNTAQQDTLYLKAVEQYRVQAHDILHIRVLTENEKYAGLFGSNASQQATNSSASSFYTSGYVVDSDGNIELPVAGKIFVLGLTVDEIQSLVHRKVSEVIYDNQVIVRLVSFRISVLGEVQAPGEYTIYQDRATILQALAMAGDMNYYADRKKVMIYRATEQGIIPYSIDLTQRNALSSPLFHVQPNDQIYVQPLPRAVFRVNVSDIVTYISAVSSSLALIVAILSLNK